MKFRPASTLLERGVYEIPSDVNFTFKRFNTLFFIHYLSISVHFIGPIIN